MKSPFVQVQDKLCGNDVMNVLYKNTLFSYDWTKTWLPLAVCMPNTSKLLFKSHTAIGFYVKTMFAHGSHHGWKLWSPDTILKVYYPRTPGTPVSSTNETDCHDITEILLKVALNTITLTLYSRHL
jgi:hypothetical protein